MLIATSKYTRPLNEVDVYREKHHIYLKGLFSARKLLFAGRQNSKLGGIIVARTQSRAEFQDILNNDPFVKAGVSEYQIFEATPSFYDPALADLYKV